MTKFLSYLVHLQRLFTFPVQNATGTENLLAQALFSETCNTLIEF